MRLVAHCDTCTRDQSSANANLAWNLCVTFPVIFFFFKETKQVSLENIDLLFGERALGTLPDDLHKEGMEMRSTAVEVEHSEKRDNNGAGSRV